MPRDSKASSRPASEGSRRKGWCNLLPCFAWQRISTRRDLRAEAMAGLKSRKVITLAATTCAIAIASCGSSSHSLGAASGGSSLSNAEVKVSECMRSHGVPSFPDPSSGGGIQTQRQRDRSRVAGVQIGSAAVLQVAAWRWPRRATVRASNGTSYPASGVHAPPRCVRLSRPTLTPPPISDRAKYSIVDDNDGAVLAPSPTRSTRAHRRSSKPRPLADSTEPGGYAPVCVTP